MVNLPYPVFGTIKDSTDTAISTRVILRNDRTGEKINYTSNSVGSYILEAANLTSGYMVTDRLSVISSYGDEENEDSFLISSSPGAKNINLTLATVAESADTTYCQPQDVYDFLGDKTTDDIGFERIRKTILRSESEIDERSGSKYKSTTVTEEEINFNQYSSWRSPEQLNIRNSSILYGDRSDYLHAFENDRIQLKNRPVISITSLYVNGAGETSADSWTELSEQSGSGGDFILTDSDSGIIDFVGTIPDLGKRKVKVTYAYGRSTVPKTIERLCVLLSVRDIITSKRTEAQFDGDANISLGGEIAISKFDSPTFNNWLNEEIDKLWTVVGNMIQKGV